MPSFNKVMMIGNLTRDPQLKNVANGVVVAEFGLAMNRKFRTAAGEDREEVCFVDCSAFGRQAETISQWCQKGKRLFVEGRLKYDTWDDKAGGGKRHKLSIVVENFQFLSTRAEDAETGAPEFGGRPVSAVHPGTMFDEKSDRPEHPDRRAGRHGRAAKQPAEQPFGEEKVFAVADIPF